MMSEDRFWGIIDATREEAKKLLPGKKDDFAKLHMRTLQEALEKLSPPELIEFDRRYHELTDRAYRWDIWGAAYWLEGGCSDDGFMDFKGCLVSLGREWYYRILKNPDELVETIGRIDIPYMQAEGFLYIASEIYQKKTGGDFPDSGKGLPPEPAGEDFDFEDEAEMKRRFPRLVSRMPSPGDIEEE